MVDLGIELQELRNSKRLTLESISKDSRVDIKFLRKMEEGDFSFLPQVYVRSFLKEYLKMLDVTNEFLLMKYDNEIRSQKRSLGFNTKTSDSSNKKNTETKNPIVESSNKNLNDSLDEDNKNQIKPNYILIGVISIVILVLISIIFSGNIKELFNSDKDKVIQKPVEAERFSEIESVQKNVSPNQLNKQKLSILSKEKVWIQIAADGKITESLFLLSGEQKFWFADNYFEILIGSVGGVSITFNDKEMPLSGSVGLVRKIRVDSNGITIMKINIQNQKSEKKNG